MSQQRVAPISREHHINGPETIADISFGGVVEFYATEGFKFVLEPILDHDGEVIGFDMKPYPPEFEMQAF